MSDKFKVIDHATFERMQQSSSSTASGTPKLRNSKYKRMTATTNFNLLQFAKFKQLGVSSGLIKKTKIRKRIVDTRIEFTKKKGKQREGGKRKKPTRLKKSILLYRQKKREQSQIQKQLSESVDQMINLKIIDSENKNVGPYNLHSCNFRPYCNCCTTPELKQYCEQLIRELNHFQRRAYAQNEIKARAHKRFIVGFRQTQSYLLINKVKLVIIATDCEYSEGEDVSLRDTIENIKTVCNDQQIPVVFAFRRRQLAYFLYKKASISCIGVLNYDGAREIFSNLVEALKKASEMYKALVLKKST